MKEEIKEEPLSDEELGLGQEDLIPEDTKRVCCLRRRCS